MHRSGLALLAELLFPLIFRCRGGRGGSEIWVSQGDSREITLLGCTLMQGEQGVLWAIPT